MDTDTLSQKSYTCTHFKYFIWVHTASCLCVLTSKDWHLHKDVMLTISCSDLRVKLWSYVSYLCLFHLPLILSLARSLSLSLPYYTSLLTPELGVSPLYSPPTFVPLSWLTGLRAGECWRLSRALFDYWDTRAVTYLRHGMSMALCQKQGTFTSLSNKEWGGPACSVSCFTENRLLSNFSGLCLSLRNWSKSSLTWKGVCKMNSELVFTWDACPVHTEVSYMLGV